MPMVDVRENYKDQHPNMGAYPTPVSFGMKVREAFEGRVKRTRLFINN